MNREKASDLVTSLFESWYSSLIRYAYSITGSKAVAQDAVQQSFMALYRSLLDGKQIDYPKAWTLCVLRREIAATWGESAETEPLSAIHHQAFTRIEPDLYATDVPRLLSYLTPREQEVLMLRMEGYKYREIAESLAISPNSVNALLSRAIAKLQKALKLPRENHEDTTGSWPSKSGPTHVCNGSSSKSSPVEGLKQHAAKTLH